MIGWRRATAEGVSDGCQTGVMPPVAALPPGWELIEYPPLMEVPGVEQARAIVGILQEEGLTGVVPRGEILWRYGEHCNVFGFEPLGVNAICEALAAVCQRVRPVVDGRRITAYVIPDKPLQPVVARYAGGNVLPMLPSGKVAAQNCAAEAKRARSGTTSFAGNRQGRGGRYSADIQQAVASHG